MQKLGREPGQVSYDEVTGLPLDPELVTDAIKEELMFMRTLQVYLRIHSSGGARNQAPEHASSTFAATLPLESLKVMFSR